MKYKGRELASINLIIRRLIAYPFQYLFAFLYCVSLSLSDGIDKGKSIWRYLI